MPKNAKITVDVWMMVDWSKTAREIADDLNVHPSRVYYWAQRLGKTPAGSSRGPKPKIDWEKVDWSNRNNADLGRQHGVSGEWVSKMRERYAPETVPQRGM